MVLRTRAVAPLWLSTAPSTPEAKDAFWVIVALAIVSDPALIEQWKQQARTVTTFTSLHDEASSTFASATEAERHFRTNHLPGLLRNVEETTVGGVSSRRVPDRLLNRAIEDAWTHETHSPSNMMQELAGRFRQAAERSPKGLGCEDGALPRPESNHVPSLLA